MSQQLKWITFQLPHLQRLKQPTGQQHHHSTNTRQTLGPVESSTNNHDPALRLTADLSDKGSSSVSTRQPVLGRWADGDCVTNQWLSQEDSWRGTARTTADAESQLPVTSATCRGIRSPLAYRTNLTVAHKWLRTPIKKGTMTLFNGRSFCTIPS